MLKVTNSNAEFGIKWKYDGRSATCTILLMQQDAEPRIVGEGKVTRYYKDPENKEIARKRSLTLALGTIPKEERKPFWEAYRTSKTKPRW